MEGTVTDPLAAAVAGLTPAQVEKALALIAENRISPTVWPGTYITVSSDGHTRYITAPDACQCRGSIRRGEIAPCYHQAGVRLYAAATGEAA